MKMRWLRYAFLGITYNYVRNTIVSIPASEVDSEAAVLFWFHVAVKAQPTLQLNFQAPEIDISSSSKFILRTYSMIQVYELELNLQENGFDPCNLGII